MKKTESGTGERRSSRRVTRFVRHTFPRHASMSQGQHDRKTREKETALQYSPNFFASNVYPIVLNTVASTIKMVTNLLAALRARP